MCLVNNLYVNGLSEVDENDSQDTLAYDDDTRIKPFYVLLVSMF